ncbi:MAG TPA: substrate-binding domain-containing protein [Nitrospiraceae bacterium]|nr:substrate-binding domain-containing protein [Nitrospiraceae bacterium]
MFTRVVMALSLLLATTMVPLLVPVTGTAGSMIIAGNGPELPTIERLARAFEKDHLGSVVEIQWEQDSDPITLVKSGEAHVAVTGQHAPDLIAIPIAWDGIAVVVDSTNPVNEVTTQQVADIFSGKVKRWSALGGPGITIQLIDRPQYQHIRHRFLEALGIVGQIPKSAKVVRSDQTAISTVAGSLPAVTYASLGVALEAVKYGVNVKLLVIDQVEAAKETVKDGRYKLRRPVLLLSKQKPNPVAEAFAGFALSKEGQDIIGEMFIPNSPLDKSKPNEGPKP